MSVDIDALLATVREALTKGSHKGGHHPRCATGHDNGCDCYARATAEPRAALDSLAAELERVKAERDEWRGDALAAMGKLDRVTEA